jgi:hypothetical protein
MTRNPNSIFTNKWKKNYYENNERNKSR